LQRWSDARALKQICLAVRSEGPVCIPVAKIREWNGDEFVEADPDVRKVGLGMVR
jgi:hypothetical protein